MHNANVLFEREQYIRRLSILQNEDRAHSCQAHGIRDFGVELAA